MQPVSQSAARRVRSVSWPLMIAATWISVVQVVLVYVLVTATWISVVSDSVVHRVGQRLVALPVLQILLALHQQPHGHAQREASEMGARQMIRDLGIRYLNVN